MYGKYCVLLTMVLPNIIPAAIVERHRRFLTPTTYPVPTIPVNSQYLAVPVRCPLKREADDRRIILDEQLMRQIYMNEVGSIDKRYLAETMADAREQFHPVRPLRKEEPNTKSTGLVNLIKDWLAHHTPDSSTGVRGTRQHVHHNFTNTYREGTSPHDDTEHLVRANRIKRNSDGSVSHVEYCTPRGKVTSDGYMHMCSSCAMTTILPANKFPRYINEVACDVSDCDCFDVRGTSHGKCKIRRQHVKMLRKVPNGCKITIVGGQQVITDNWEIFDYPLRVGCECVFNKLSVFATFIPKPSG